ncbi:recombinase family protein [Streptomyces diastaticus]|uniref:recombinase family protein n=1 Tax=Streptomyces diastaticus TaxID=1956 RepID=UPI0038301881
MKPKPITAVILYVYLRLSRENDGSASVDTQRAAYKAWMTGGEFTRWLAELGVPLDRVQVVEYVDSGVSGAKALELRKNMKRLMGDVERSARLDRGGTARMMVAWKLDRWARSVSEFLRLVAWAEAHHTAVATTDNTIDTATPTGRMVATVLAALAEWERGMIASRITEGHATRRSQGRWSSGQPPFGYRIVRRDGAAYLEVDPDQARQVTAAVNALTNGGTVAGTARLTGLSEPQWRRLLKSPVFRGQREHGGDLVCEADGITPVQFAEPILSAAELVAVRNRMNALATGADRAPRHAANLCAGMATCSRCSGPLNGGSSDKGVRLYKCKLGHLTIYAATLDQRVAREFLDTWGSYSETVVRLEGGNDLSAEMIEAKEQAERLAARMATAGPLMLGTLESLAEDLEATYARLRAAHDPNVREVQVPTGRTMAQAWEAMADDIPGRTRLLAGMGLRVTLFPKQSADRLSVKWGPADPYAAAMEAAEMEEWAANQE